MYHDKEKTQPKQSLLRETKPPEDTSSKSEKLGWSPKFIAKGDPSDVKNSILGDTRVALG